MATDDRQVQVAGQASAPARYVIPGNGQIRPKCIFAKYDGTATTTAYQPAMKLTSDAGLTVGIFPALPTVAAGASVNVSWFHGVDEDADTGTSGGGSGTITDLTSSAGTVALTNPAGPITNIDLPASGVTAATYGDGSHVSQMQVNAQGVVTSASSVPISGVPGSMGVIFDQTLLVSAATIDTGAAGVASGFSALMVVILARADGAVFSGDFGLQFNADGAAHYDYIWTDNSNGVSTPSVSTGQTNTKMMEGPGANIGAGIFGVASAIIPGYTQTTADKTHNSLGGFAETSGHSELVHLVGTWRSTAAITRIALVCGVGNLVAGSRMTIYGLP